MTGKMINKLTNADPRTPFVIFAQKLYRENCDERIAYGEPQQTFEQYLEKNMKFLLDNFSEK